MSTATKPKQEYLAAGEADRQDRGRQDHPGANGEQSGQNERDRKDRLRNKAGKDFTGVSTPSDLMAAAQSFLFNDSDDPTSFTNTFQFWDSLPKYASDHLNSLEDIPKGTEIRFTHHGEPLILKQSPGTYEKRARALKDKDERWVTRYPAHREKVVEMALMKIAAEEGGIYSEDKGGNEKSPYGVKFSVRQVSAIAKEIGHSMNHTQVVEAIDVLTSCTIEISSENGRAKSKGTILSNYACTNEHGSADNSPDAQWVVFFNPLVANAINTATYRQVNIRHFCNLKSFGINIVERLFNLATNISPDHPHRFSYSELKVTTSGLNYSRARDGIAYLEKEIKKLVDRGILHGYEKEAITGRNGKNRGRLSIIDAKFTLIPSDVLVKECKRANRRQSLVEQRINLTPRLRSERQKPASQLALKV